MTYSGGLTVSSTILDTLKQPGFITSESGGTLLRKTYEDGVILKPQLLSRFGMAVFLGHYDLVKTAIDSDSAPLLSGTETPFEYGYASLAVFGAQRVKKGRPGSLRYAEMLGLLIANGLAVNRADIMGNTALHHATRSQASPRTEILLRSLVTAGARIDGRNRFGEVCILGALRLKSLGMIETLMWMKAEMDIEDADGVSPKKLLLSCGPKVVCVVMRWTRRHAGVRVPYGEKCCDECGKPKSSSEKRTSSLRLCSRCKLVRYCSVECQASSWIEHKKSCSSFTTENAVVLTPFYDTPAFAVSAADYSRQAMGFYADPPVFYTVQSRLARVSKKIARGPLSMKIKVQIPDWEAAPASEPGDLLVYTKKRRLVCTVRHEDDPSEYDRIAHVIRTKGTQAAKAYFMAELQHASCLVVRISHLLAEQPW
ncbi:hypothetical protein C8R46DRAFT_912265 [Mycena filopes]|nr:hypothetical protein C8R46DRAFT_912265 [Mycena filopes]